MEERIAKGLETLFERHRVVFWYDTKQELRTRANERVATKPGRPDPICNLMEGPQRGIFAQAQPVPREQTRNLAQNPRQQIEEQPELPGMRESARARLIAEILASRRITL